MFFLTAARLFVRFLLAVVETGNEVMRTFWLSMLPAAGPHLFDLIVIVVHFGATSDGGCTTSTCLHLLTYTTSDASRPRFHAGLRNGTVGRWLLGTAFSIASTLFIQGPFFLSSRYSALSVLYVWSIRSCLFVRLDRLHLPRRLGLIGRFGLLRRLSCLGGDLLIPLTYYFFPPRCQADGERVLLLNLKHLCRLDGV